MLVQAFVAEFAIEALDVTVLHGSSWLDQEMANAMLLRPGHERPTGEFRAVVGTHRQRVATEGGSLIQQARDVLA